MLYLKDKSVSLELKYKMKYVKLVEINKAAVKCHQIQYLCESNIS